MNRLRQTDPATSTGNAAPTVIEFPQVNRGKLEPETSTTEGCACSH